MTSGWQHRLEAAHCLRAIGILSRPPIRGSAWLNISESLPDGGILVNQAFDPRPNLQVALQKQTPAECMSYSWWTRHGFMIGEHSVIEYLSAGTRGLAFLPGFPWRMSAISAAYRKMQCKTYRIWGGDKSQSHPFWCHPRATNGTGTPFPPEHDREITTSNRGFT
jgi:hypothetical protein